MQERLCGKKSYSCNFVLIVHPNSGRVHNEKYKNDFDDANIDEEYDEQDVMKEAQGSSRDEEENGEQIVKPGNVGELHKSDEEQT